MDWGLKKVDVINVLQRTQWYSLVRLFFLLAISIPGVLTMYLFDGFSQQVRTDLAVVTVAIATNLLFYGLTHLHRSDNYLKVLAALGIIVDIMLISLFIFLNGGIESRSPILYAVPILIAAALFGRKAIYLVATGCAGLYVAIILGDYLNIIHTFGAFDPSLRHDYGYVLNTICFFPAVIGVIALSVDFITTLLFEKQQELSESLDALEDAQETAKIGSWEWDIIKDQITWSKELYRIYGKKPVDESFTFSEYLTMLQPDKAVSHRSVVLNAMNKRISFKIDHEITLPDGTTKFLHGEGRPVTNSRGEVVKMVGTTQDVTEIYNLDLAKQEFVSLASHQLRTPASGVKAFLSLLIDGHTDPLTRQQKKFLRRAYDSNDRQLEIIDNLLSLASIESGKLAVAKEPVELHALIKQTVPVHMPRAREKQQKISTSGARKRMFIEADVSALRMVIDNLLSNAIKYTPEKGSIAVTTRHSSRDAYIEITDTGIGISKRDIPLLFQKFSRVNNPASKTVEGSGLGLYMAKYIVELHHGTITVKSRPHKGTTFTIRLPLLRRSK